MNTPDSRLADWIGEGPELAPADLLGLVLDRVYETQQRWPIWSWPIQGWTRWPQRRGVVIAVGALLVVAVLIAGPRLASMLSPGVGPGSSSSPSASVGSSPRPLPAGRLDAGTYAMTPVGGGSPTMTFTVGDGWETCCQSGTFALSRATETDPGMVGLAYWRVDTVYADPCRQTPLGASIGPSATDLAAALEGMAGVDATTPEPTRLAGHDGVYLELTVRDDIDCEPEALVLWTLGRAARYAQAVGELDRLWILDVDGQRVVLDAESQRQTSASDRAALDGVIDTIQFEQGGGP